MRGFIIPLYLILSLASIAVAAPATPDVNADTAMLNRADKGDSNYGSSGSGYGSSGSSYGSSGSSYY